MSASAINGRKAASLQEVSEACKIVVLCEDIPARDRAMEIFNRITANFKDDLTFAITCWNFGELAEASSGQSAAEAAALADIIVFSIRTSDLPSTVNNWLDGIAQPKGKTDGALAFMLTDPSHPAERVETMVSQLMAAAHRLGLEFIPLAPTPAVKKIEPESSPEWIVTATRKKVVDRPPYDHWGLNE